MNIDTLHFTPWLSLAGGALIGLAAAILILGAGRIAGISGIVGGLVDRLPDRAWRWAFLAGLVIAPILWRAAHSLPDARIATGWVWLAVAGFVVGLGTRYGSGCTSGHGVCGLARLSPRSLVATLVFMAAGFATVFIVRHVVGA